MITRSHGQIPTDHETDQTASIQPPPLAAARQHVPSSNTLSVGTLGAKFSSQPGWRNGIREGLKIGCTPSSRPGNRTANTALSVGASASPGRSPTTGPTKGLYFARREDLSCRVLGIVRAPSVGAALQLARLRYRPPVYVSSSGAPYVPAAVARL